MQTVNIELYIEMVKQCGIEEAYKQRFRDTGRTVRDVLTLSHMLSAGEKIMIITDGSPGNSMESALVVLNKVRHTIDQLGMKYTNNSWVLRNAHNSGELIVFPNTACTRGLRHKEYKLHAS